MIVDILSPCHLSNNVNSKLDHSEDRILENNDNFLLFVLSFNIISPWFNII